MYVPVYDFVRVAVYLFNFGGIPRRIELNRSLDCASVRSLDKSIADIVMRSNSSGSVVLFKRKEDSVAWSFSNFSMVAGCCAEVIVTEPKQLQLINEQCQPRSKKKEF